MNSSLVILLLATAISFVVSFPAIENRQFSPEPFDSNRSPRPEWGNRRGEERGVSRGPHRNGTWPREGERGQEQGGFSGRPNEGANGEWNREGKQQGQEQRGFSGRPNENGFGSGQGGSFNGNGQRAFGAKNTGFGNIGRF